MLVRITTIVIFFLLISTLTYAQICPGTQGEILWECWQNIYDDEFGELTSRHTYPNHPDVIQTRYRIQSPENYDNDMGSRMRGFLYIPSIDTVTFNVTGNDKAHFYLSTDADPLNKVLIAFTDDYTGTEEHDKFATQTSVGIALQSGVDYYFEVIQVDGGGSDHVTIWWKTIHVDTANWNTVTADYIKGIDCLGPICPELGSPCDDGNASTTDDKEDGYCNCVGVPSTSNICIGERGFIENFRYDSIPGGDLNDLYIHPDYPAMPSYSQVLDILGRASENTVSDEGDLIQAYLTVPVTGDYKFNVTGDDETILFISSDDDPANKQAHQAFVSGWTYMWQHDKYIWQNTSFINLQAGQYYYIEINHKEGGGSEHFSAFWQTPFTEDGVWKRIPSMYIHNYDCEIACIPQGSLCDDGDPFTNNDMYDNNCNCVGTPCSGLDCDSPLANYVPYDKCSVTDQINNNPENNWLSCQIDFSPNPIRDRGHWIHYDLGVKHELYQTQVWNYNVTNETDKGFEMVAVDYSLDGILWTEFGTYTWPLATGDTNYSGFMGPDFAGLEARFVLISSLDDTTTCRGIAKIAFTAIKCPGLGVPCDDGNPNTVDDKYDGNCICAGVYYLENRCDDQFLVLGDTILTNNNFSAIDYVQSISTIDIANKVSFIGGNSVTLNAGFETDTTATFIAAIDTCDTSSAAFGGLSNRRVEVIAKQQQAKIDKIKGLQVVSHADSDIQIIKFYLEHSSNVRIDLVRQNQDVVFTLIDKKYKNAGLYSKKLRTKKLSPGIYSVILTTEKDVRLEKMIVL